jgi:uncharacterized protein YfaS (alpha-2-macroglobulin family)
MRVITTAALAAVWLSVQSVSPFAHQGASLTILRASPSGDLQRVEDASEIRLVFSEPMVAIGDESVDRPSWASLTPEIDAAWYWAGTRTLVISPDPGRGVPLATRLRVTIGPDAVAASGRRLGRAFELVLTTPRPRLISAVAVRSGGRVGDQALLVLRFNQAIAARQVIEGVEVSYEPYRWEPPLLSPASWEAHRAVDPDNLRRYEEKVRAARRVAERADRVAVRLATDWDEDTFPRLEEQVVLETVDSPPPGARFSIAVTERLRGEAGPEPAQPHALGAPLPPVFFAGGPGCTVGCYPGDAGQFHLTVGANLSAIRAALTVTDRRPDRVVAHDVGPSQGPDHVSLHVNLSDFQLPRMLPMAERLIVLDPTLGAIDGQELGYRWVGVIQTGHEPAALFVPGSVVEARDGGRLAYSIRNYGQVVERVQPVAVEALVPTLRRLAVARPPAPGIEGSRIALAGQPDEAETRTLDLASTLEAGRGFAWVSVEPGAPLAGSRPWRPADPRWVNVVQVTDLGITVAGGSEDLLARVTRLADGAPVNSADVEVRSLANEVLWRGITDADGVVHTPRLPRVPADTRTFFDTVVIARVPGNMAFLPVARKDAAGWDGSSIRAAVFTDRGVYRPGETVSFKAVVRRLEGRSLGLVPPASAPEVIIADDKGREIVRRPAVLGRWGSEGWTWQVPADAAIGRYEVLFKERNAPDWMRVAAGQFQVAAYRRPDFEVAARLNRTSLVAGDRLSATVEAQYLFGAGMPGAGFRWWMTPRPTRAIPAAIHERYRPQDFAFGFDPDQQARAAAPRRDTGVLDSDGRFETSAAVEAAGAGAAEYQFGADVMSDGNQSIAASASAVVHPARFYIGLARPRFFVDASSGIEARVVTIDLDGLPVNGTTVALQVLREAWLPPSDSGRPFEWIRREDVIGSASIVTGSPDAPRLRLPGGGAYLLRATARDEAGRETRSDLSFYAFGGGAGFRRDRAELTPERTAWNAGETARLLVRSPWNRAEALVTVEAAGVRRHRRVTLTAEAQTIEVPLTDDDAPNVVVSVSLLKGRTPGEPTDGDPDPGRPAVLFASADLRVESALRRLDVSVTADAAEYQPRRDVRVTARVRDSAGRPARSEITLWAVDEGVLSLTGYATPDLASVIHRPLHRGVIDVDSRRSLAPRVPMARNPFEALGVFNTGITDATTQLTMLGESVNVQWNVEGGSITDLSRRDANAPLVRTDFRPLAFWVGSATTDAQGIAAIRATLPDTLTTYRIMAVAADTASRFGSNDTTIRVSRRLVIQPAFPRFLARGDAAAFGGVVTNNGQSPGEAVVTIRSVDPALVHFPESRRTLRLAPGESRAVRFDATARAQGSARVRMTVEMAGDSDAFESTLPVIAPLRLHTLAAYGSTASTAREMLRWPPGAASSAGGLTVSLSSTALVGLEQAVRYLETYPYECAEQRASRALARTLVASLGDGWPIGGGGERAGAEARQALNLLGEHQCQSQGFALWPGQCRMQSAYLTAYVLHVLAVGREYGLQATTIDTEGALEYLARSMRDSPEVSGSPRWPAWAATRAYVLKVLAEHGRKGLEADIRRLWAVRDRLPVFALSYLADAAHTAGLRLELDDLSRRLANALRVDADRAFVEELDDPSLVWLWNSNARATAVVLDGFVRRGEAQDMIGPLARGVLAAQREARWSTTHENAMALEALVRYARALEADVPDMRATVSLGSRRVTTARFRGRDDPARDVRVPAADLIRRGVAAAPLALDIETRGTGRVHYTARLEYPAPEPAEAMTRGLRIVRRYERLDPASRSVGAASTTFDAGDLVKVTITVTVPREVRFVAVSDPLPAGLEAVDGSLATTARDLDDALQPDGGSRGWMDFWRMGGFDHIRRHDSRVEMFATRLAAGRHEVSYLARAATAGAFTVAGARAEEMYAPEVAGRSAADTVIVRPAPGRPPR